QFVLHAGRLAREILVGLDVGRERVLQSFDDLVEIQDFHRRAARGLVGAEVGLGSVALLGGLGQLVGEVGRLLGLGFGFFAGGVAFGGRGGECLLRLLQVGGGLLQILRGLGK